MDIRLSPTTLPKFVMHLGHLSVSRRMHWAQVSNNMTQMHTHNTVAAAPPRPRAFLGLISFLLHPSIHGLHLGGHKRLRGGGVPKR
jgi:hypothetical protein